MSELTPTAFSGMVLRTEPFEAQENHTSQQPKPKAVHHTLLEEAENKDEDGGAGADFVGVEGGGALRLGGQHGKGDWSEVRRDRDSAGSEIQIFVGSLSKRGSSCLTHLSPLRDAACL